MKEIQVAIHGLRPYLQHRRPQDEKDVEKSKQITNILRKNAYDVEAGAAEAALGVYLNSKGKPYIPADQIQESMTRAGTQIRVAGQGKKTYKDFMRSYLFITPEQIPLTPETWEVDRRFVRINRAGIMRHRPIFNDWAAKMKITLTDDTIPVDVVLEILRISGTRVGIGDYRPRFGLFEVAAFDLVK